MHTITEHNVYDYNGNITGLRHVKSNELVDIFITSSGRYYRCDIYSLSVYAVPKVSFVRQTLGEIEADLPAALRTLWDDDGFVEKFCSFD